MTFLIVKCLLLKLKFVNLNHYFYDFDIYQSADSEIPSKQRSGKNEKKLLVVVKELDFTEENKAFLSKILSAVKYKMEDDASILVIPDGEVYAVNELLINADFEHAIIFGIKPKDLGLSIETYLYSPFKIARIQILVGHSLETIKTSTNDKKNLWTALQAIFV